MGHRGVHVLASSDAEQFQHQNPSAAKYPTDPEAGHPVLHIVHVKRVTHVHGPHR